MKIAFATIGDARDIRRGSGTPYHIWKELERQGCDVHLVGPLNINIPFATRLFKYSSTKLGQKYFSYRDPFTGRVIGKEATRLLKFLEYDVVLTNDYSIAGYTKTNKPIILFTDDIFPFNYSENIHPWLENLSLAGVHFCHHSVSQGLKHASVRIFASDYARREAEKYETPKSGHFAVVPYGANVESPNPHKIQQKKSIEEKGGIDLLFVGKDWKLKGGEIAVRTVRLLRQRGIRARLNVVGVDLSDQINDEFITFWGLLNKDVGMENRELSDLYLTCDALIVPSKAEGYGLAFVEAAAYGMPSLAYRSSGVMTAVQSGKSGILFDLSEDETSFANQIENWIRQPDLYKELVKGAREHFEQTANWRVALSTLMRIVFDHLEQQGAMISR